MTILKQMMSRHLAHGFQQPLAAFIMAGASGALLAAWAYWAGSNPLALGDWLSLLPVAGALVVMCVLADIYPIHVTYHTKVSITTLLLYLIAVWLPLPLAGLAAGIARLSAELIERRKRGSLPSDIVTGVMRWALVAMVTACVAHLPTQSDAELFVVLVAAAATMLLMDVCSIVFELAPISGEPPRQIIVSMVKDVGVIEAVHYNLGVLAALVAGRNFWELALLIVPIGLAYHSFKSMKEMREGTHHFLESLADAVDLRDPYTGGHSRRVTEYTVGILKQLKLAGPDAELIIAAARVHDIGKIGVPDAVLNKPGKLTPEEWTIMASHAERGAEILTRYSDFVRGVKIVRHHHERWDGKGYPDGLAGPAIPFGARVIAVADSFDAMTSDRPYRCGMPVEKAAQVLRDDAGQQWDVRIVQAFLDSIAVQLAQPAPPQLGNEAEQATNAARPVIAL